MTSKKQENYLEIIDNYTAIADKLNKLKKFISKTNLTIEEDNILGWTLSDEDEEEIANVNVYNSNIEVNVNNKFKNRIIKLFEDFSKKEKVYTKIYIKYLKGEEY